MAGDDDFGVDPSTLTWMNANQGTPTWDGSGTWDTGQSWWDRNTPSANTLAELRGAQQSLGGVKPLADAGSGMPARPPYPQAGIHQGAPIDALGQYLQMLQARQQAVRTQFLPKTAGLLGG